MEKVRIDKWLWSVRIFKSRSQATEACRSAKIRINDTNTKASSMVAVNDLIDVKKNGFNLQFKVVKLIAKRVSATLAQPCYEDLTSEEELNKFKNWFVGKAMAERRDKGEGRPTKKERREIDTFKDEYLEWANDFDD